MQNTHKSGLQSYKGGAKKRDEKNMAKEDSKFVGNHSNGYMSGQQTNVNAIPLVKNFYKEPESVAKRSEKENEEFLKENFIKCTGNNVPKPCLTFEESGFPKHVLAKIKEAGFEKPSPIQSASWPVVLQGRDMVGIAQTGSGKTLSFILPAIVHALA